MAEPAIHLTIDQKACNHDTWTHIHTVQFYLTKVMHHLLERSLQHDQTKLTSPEVEIFTELTPKLASSTYGSQEYEGFRKELGIALAHHYGHNRHHPEHFKNGVDDMNLLDLLEMLCDWTAASERHNDGNIRRSIEINTGRFNLSPQLVRILENTVDVIRG